MNPVLSAEIFRRLHKPLDTVLIVRSIDRICRRSENIVEHLCFMCDGITVKHRVKLSGSEA